MTNPKKACEFAAQFFEEIAAEIKILPAEGKDADEYMINNASMCNQLESCLANLYREYASNLRQAAGLIESIQN